MEYAEPSSSGLPVIDTLPAAEALISEALDAGDDASIRLRWVAGQNARQNTELPALISTWLVFPQACYAQSIKCWRILLNGLSLRLMSCDR